MNYVENLTKTKFNVLFLSQCEIFPNDISAKWEKIISQPFIGRKEAEAFMAIKKIY